MKASIKMLEERLAYSDPKNPWVKLYFDRVEFADGRQGNYNRIIEGRGTPGVAILPIRGASVGLVRQFRYPIGKESWEIPRGFADFDEPRLDAARELAEETGVSIAPQALVDLGIVYPNSGLLATEVQLFAANCEDEQENSSLTDDEVDEFRWVEVEELYSLIDSGEITDAITLCAILRSRLRHIF